MHNIIDDLTKWNISAWKRLSEVLNTVNFSGKISSNKVTTQINASKFALIYSLGIFKGVWSCSNVVPLDCT